MMMRVLTTTALTLLAGAAMAQSQVTTPSERMANDFAPVGARVGSFLVIPKADVSVEYNDNIYATTNNTESDIITTVTPEISARSNWNRHALNAIARGEIQRYADNDREDQENFLVATDGRLDVLRKTSIGGGVAYERTHEERGDPNTTASAEEPTQVDTLTARAGVQRELGKVVARFDTEAKQIDYDDNRTTGGTLINGNLRDRNEYTQALRVGYRITDQFEGFVRGTVDTRAYESKGTSTTRNRSSHGNSVVAGTNFDVSGKTKGEVYAGVMDRNYVDPGFEDVTEPTFGGKVTWNVTQLTSLIGKVDRTVEETTIGASSAYVATAYKADVEHALTRSILLKGGVGFANNEYQGNGSQREDDIVSANVGADYALNRCLKAGIGYTYRDRDSNVTAGDFSRNTVLVKLTGSF
jgi:hypothetical protein